MEINPFDMNTWPEKSVTPGWGPAEDGTAILIPYQFAEYALFIITSYILETKKRRNDIFSLSILLNVIENYKNGESTYVIEQQVGEIIQEVKEVCKLLNKKYGNES